MVDYPFYDKQPGPERREKLNELYATWENAMSSIIKGDSGWSPLIRAVTHLDSVVLELHDWTGGQGSKPTEVGYLGAAGYVSDTSLAIDFRGPLGLKGDAASVSVGTVTTTAPGTSVSVINSGTSSNAVFDFEIPRGDTGLKGDKGDTGDAATISVGTVITGAPGTAVQVVNSGTSSAAVFDFTIPRGEDGSGSGDMTKAVYDSVGDGVVNASRSTPWAGITDKPVVIAAGADAASARLVIDAVSSGELTAGLGNKVDKVTGKGLSTEDFTTAEKTKLSGIAEGATANQTDAYLLDRVNHTGSQAISTVTGLQDSLDSKQNTLISGTNLKTINGESILGSGDLVVGGGGGSSGPSLVGSTSVEENTSTTYEITNYNSFSVYSVAVSSGTVSISGSTITFNAPAYTPALVSTLTLTVDGVTTNFPISITEKYFDAGVDIDGLSSLVTIQTDWDAGTTYATGANVIVRKGPLSFLEFTSLVNGNVGNIPETSPTQWQQVYNNNSSTSGYFGEVLGNKCVVDKGEWLSTTSYSIGDMVVVKNIPTPLKQSDLIAYVAKTANTNKPPASNPADWEQRNALPTGTSLAQTLGIGNTTPEVLINNDSGWLKFVHQGKIKYIAKKPFMHTVSWDDIAKAEAVYGNRTVRIGSRLFRVSLLSGAEADPSSWTTSSTATDNKGSGSEWNELVYRVHNTVPTDGSATNQGGKQVGLNWWNFTDADIVIGGGNGRATWCKETLAYNTAVRVGRGSDSLSLFSYYTSSGTSTAFGWRPCLTLISDEELEGSLYKAEATGVGPSVASLQYDPITDTGYYGEVPSAQFYTGTQISTATGVTSGTLQNDTEGWLKFYWHGQVLFIAKKTYRYNLSWDNINSANAVYGVNLGSAGKTTITHTGGTKYVVKLMKGAIKDPSPASGGGRQWNELLYRVCTGTETGEIGANWATLNPSTDLGINSGNGSYTWCQEVYQPNTADRVIRGYGSLSSFYNVTSSNTDTNSGWRPCLAFSV